MNTQSYLACRIGKEWYGIHIQHIVEVLHFVAVNQLPNSEFLGVISLRDAIVPILDLRLYFGIQAISYQLDTPIIAVQIDGLRLGLIVDEADDVLHIPREAVTPFTEKHVTGVYHTQERMLFLVDMQDMFATNPQWVAALDA